MAYQDLIDNHRTERVGRKLLNCFDIEEIAVLPRNYWRYYDWCVKQELDMVAWVQMIDTKRSPKLTFSENLEGCLWKDECKRFHAGEHVPPWKEPEGCHEYIESLEKSEKNSDII